MSISYVPFSTVALLLSEKFLSLFLFVFHVLVLIGGQESHGKLSFKKLLEMLKNTEKDKSSE